MFQINSVRLSFLVRYISYVFLGCIAFFSIVGPRALYPTNIGWLGHGDRAQHYLGWAFFRNADWSFPIGANLDYGLDIGSAIIFSDSNPLLAFLFKPLSGLFTRAISIYWFVVSYMLYITVYIC